MESLSKEYVCSVAGTIWSQLLHTTSLNVLGSWGIETKYATQIVRKINDSDLAMACLVLKVNGRLFKGEVVIALDEGVDYYRIYFNTVNGLEEKSNDICFDELGSILDSMIEKGDMSDEEYDKFSKEELMKMILSA